jgi:hypothetical protein
LRRDHIRTPYKKLGLSSAFDSAAATMRLAALTGTAEEVEEFSRTFKMPIPDINDINRANPALSMVATTLPLKPKPKLEPPVFSKPKTIPAAPLQSKSVENDNAGNSNLLLIVVAVAVVLLVLLWIFVF